LRTVNVSELEQLLTLHSGEVQKQEGPRYIDLSKLGYQKLLGKGEIRIPITITINRFSKLAAEKVGKAGGKILPAGSV
jgi:large subunit ribosomal protein L15